MDLYWAGKNITSQVNITGCVHRDVCRGRSDCLELTLDHAAAWYRWGPEEDDEIRVVHEKDDTGTLYLNTILPEGDRYRVLATSVKRAAARKTWKSYYGTTLGRLFESCAAECQMSAKLYGTDENYPYLYALRENEGSAAFLSRIGAWEGMAVKALNGTFHGISIAWAQKREPEMEIEIRADREGVRYRRQENLKLSALTVRTPWTEATARDTTAKGSNTRVITCLPAQNLAQAGRWARGLLLWNNRTAEEIRIETGLNTRLTAMTRVEITGNTDMSGAWIVDEAEHDLFNRRTSVKLLRVIETIR